MLKTGVKLPPLNPLKTNLQEEQLDNHVFGQEMFIRYGLLVQSKPLELFSLLHLQAKLFHIP